MNKNLLVDRSYDFALRIVKLCKTLREKHEYVFANQILKCGTSIGANLAESRAAQSRADFLTKVSIAFKECMECHFWIRLLMDSETIPRDQLESLLDECEELNKMLAASQKKLRQPAND